MNKREQRNWTKRKLKSVWRRTAPVVRSVPEDLALLKWWRHQKQVHQKLYFTRSSSSYSYANLKIQKLLNGLDVVFILWKS